MTDVQDMREYARAVLDGRRGAAGEAEALAGMCVTLADLADRYLAALRILDNTADLDPEGVVCTAIDELAEAKDARDATLDEVQNLRRTLSFARSMIRSGERESAQAAAVFDAALSSSPSDEVLVSADAIAKARALASEIREALDDPKRVEWGMEPWEHMGDVEKDVRVLIAGLIPARERAVEPPAGETP